MQYIRIAFELNMFKKKRKIYTWNKNIIINIYRIQGYDSIMCGYFCTGFIDFMLKGKSFFDYINLISPNNYDKNDKIIQNNFSN